jgi:diguanylate cyclase (GGDEF)-like protein/PAS domain S-box-containing protein
VNAPAAHKHNARVDAGLTRLLFDNLPHALVTNVAISLLLVAGVWQVQPHAALLGWLVCLWLVTLGRWQLLRAYRRCTDDARAKIWARRFTLGSLAAGAAWSLAAFFLTLTHDVVHQAFSVFILGGLAAGAVATSASHRPAYFAFMLPMLAPLPVLLALENSTLQWVMAGMVLIFIAVLARSVGLIHASLRHSLELGLNNEALAHEARRELDEHVRTTRALHDSEQRLRTIFETEPECVKIIGADGHLKQMNPAGLAMIEVDHPEQVIGQRVEGIIAPEYRVAFSDLTRRVLRGERGTLVFQVIGLKGTKRWLETHAVPLHEANGEISLLGITRDISARKAAEEALFLERDLAEITLRAIGDAVVTTTPEGRVRTLNAAAARMTGWTEAEACGRPFAEVFALSTAIDQADAGAAIIARCLDMRAPRSPEDRLLLTPRDRSEARAVELTAAPILGRADDSILGAVVVCHDVSALSHVASHDALTGLINRREFVTRLTHAVESARVDHAEHALCYIDLDQFKVVNDSCGHAAGDELLCEIAGVLRGAIRDGDSLARLGGDEFGLLLPGCPLDKAASIADLLRDKIAGLRFAWGGRPFEIGASIGVVSIRANNGSVGDLLRVADSACYVAKEEGRNRVHVYQPDDMAVAEHRSQMAWVQKLRQALEEDRFVLHYQPIVALHPGEPRRHIEILLRMQGDDGSLIPPSMFIPTAERYQLMPALDRWVVRRSLERLAPLLRKRDMVCGINLSGQSLTDANLLPMILAEFDRLAIPPDTVCFEITETSAISHLERARELLLGLKQAGCQLALDDFGSGLSSFSYLKQLPVDYLKIDGSFVRDIAQNPFDRAIVGSMVQVARSIGVRTVAEFVEDDIVLAYVRDLGVDFGQGYGIARPQALDNLIRSSRKSVGKNRHETVCDPIWMRVSAA